jgi:hypothetical protein
MLALRPQVAVKTKVEIKLETKEEGSRHQAQVLKLKKLAQALKN